MSLDESFFKKVASYLSFSRVRPFLLYAAITVYSLLGAGISKATAEWASVGPDARISDTSSCLNENSTFAAHIYYVISVGSTIGYGVVLPCSGEQKGFTIVASIVGLLLFIAVLMDAGDRLEKLCHLQVARRKRRSAVGKIRLQIRRGSVVPIGIETGQSDEDLDPENEDLNPGIGLVFLLVVYILVWIYFRFAEYYSVTDALFYSAMMFLAGDFHMTRFEFAVPMFILVTIGFSMVSMVINIVLANMQRFMNRLQRSMKNQIDRANKDQLPLPSADEMFEKAVKEAGGGISAKMSLAACNLDKARSMASEMIEKEEQIREAKAQAEEAAVTMKRWAETAKAAADHRPPAVEKETVDAAASAAPDVIDREVLAQPSALSKFVQAVVGAKSSSTCTDTPILPQTVDRETAAEVHVATAVVQTIDDTETLSNQDAATQIFYETTDRSVEAKPEMRTIRMQHPTPRSSQQTPTSSRQPASKPSSATRGRR